MLKSLTTAASLWILFLAFPSLTIADDFGKLLENAAKEAIRRPVTRPQDRVASESTTHQSYPVRTADGWTLVAQRYPPKRNPPPGTMPVILCHGLTYNSSFWDLDPACSFADYLSGLGYDVWVVDLRGCGRSQKWVWKLDQAPEMVVGGAIRRLTHGKVAPTGYATVDPKAANWNLDQHIAYDVPALVKLVRQHTQAPAVAWVGHSMGGIVAICHLARYPNPGIGRLVTIGSQVTMPDGQLPLQFLGEMLETRQKQLAGNFTGKEVVAVSKTSVHNMFFNVRNVDPKVYAALAGWATDVPALGLMKQYSDLAQRHELWDVTGRFNYAQALGNITVPIFLSCGAADQFAPPVVQKYLYDHVGSADKTVVIFGRDRGLSVDAGHDDALVGMNSRAEVYPVIERWLRGERP